MLKQNKLYKITFVWAAMLFCSHSFAVCGTNASGVCKTASAPVIAASQPSPKLLKAMQEAQQNAAQEAQEFEKNNKQ